MDIFVVSCPVDVMTSSCTYGDFQAAISWSNLFKGRERGGGAGPSLGHDDWGVLIFPRRKFTIHPTDEFPASRIPTKPYSQQQGTRDLPD